jgi:hypothetical protein
MLADVKLADIVVIGDINLDKLRTFVSESFAAFASCADNFSKIVIFSVEIFQL